MSIKFKLTITSILSKSIINCLVSLAVPSSVQDYKFIVMFKAMQWDLSKLAHQTRREQLQSLAARSVGRILRSLEVTNFRSLRSYYLALVRSQLYSLSFSVFSEEEFERSQKIFIQSVFFLTSLLPNPCSLFFVGNT
jgi:hypothetical protein